MREHGWRLGARPRGPGRSPVRRGWPLVFSRLLTGPALAAPRLYCRPEGRGVALVGNGPARTSAPLHEALLATQRGKALLSGFTGGPLAARPFLAGDREAPTARTRVANLLLGENRPSDYIATLVGWRGPAAEARPGVPAAALGTLHVFGLKLLPAGPPETAEPKSP